MQDIFEGAKAMKINVVARMENEKQIFLASDAIRQCDEKYGFAIGHEELWAA